MQRTPLRGAADLWRYASILGALGPGWHMVRPRIRLGTLTLLIAIVALSLGIVGERRRNAILRDDLVRARAEAANAEIRARQDPLGMMHRRGRLMGRQNP